MTWLRMLASVLAGLATADTAYARVQHQMFCWSSDVEFPIACSEDDDSDDDDGEET